MENTMAQTLYRRILIKISGEALMGTRDFGFDMPQMNLLAEQIKQVRTRGIQVALVIGAGNLFRGNHIDHDQIARTTADQMGMLATTMNALALRDVLQSYHVPTCVVNAFALEGVAPRHDPQDTIQRLNSGQVVIIAGGTGNPFFTTDSAGALRGIEIQADLLIKATKVDGVYDKDPIKHADAQRYERLSFRQAVEDKIQIMDTTAFVLCEENGLDIRVMNIFQTGALLKLVDGEPIGTLVTHEP